ncbi:hypothetical protein BB560_005118 [Smittium megazygosporum]|uniref:Cytochrome c oxidase subunit 6B n=1 Tax=Smittium megazygosporum TaxID=133381 RepID=A0A2T9Z7C9_9FUNG|nr:hypothetical protein BB560_005118 [Smittium megazygosporum]
MSDYEIETPGYDSRFPHTNSTKRCWQNYFDFHSCEILNGEGSTKCTTFFRAFKSLCPNDWVCSSFLFL